MRGELLEHARVRRSPSSFHALALGDVGDAAANQLARGARQAHQAHFAGDVVPERVAMQPLENRRLAGQRAIEMARAIPSDGVPSGCSRRADACRTRSPADSSRVHPEEAHGVVVARRRTGLDRCRARRSPPARFRPACGSALRSRASPLGLAAVGDVAQADDVDVAAVEAHLADGDLGVEQRAVLVTAPRLARGKVDVRVVQARREALERTARTEPLLGDGISRSSAGARGPRPRL